MQLKTKQVLGVLRGAEGPMSPQGIAVALDLDPGEARPHLRHLRRCRLAHRIDSDLWVAAPSDR